MKNQVFLAIDIGATSGRSMLGQIEDGKVTLKTLTRFVNPIINIHNKYYWDIYLLFEEIKRSLKDLASLDIHIDAIGIDTWGVDFVYLATDGTFLGAPRSYRDPYTVGVPEKYFKKIPKEEVYRLTGIQFLNFNTLYQLFAAKEENSSALEHAEEILFIPDALIYMLTGKRIAEYTITSTAQLINPHTKKIEKKLLVAAGVNPEIVPPLVLPGSKIGYLYESIVKECGLQKNVPVIAVAGHDTASAVVAIPAQDIHFAYISSGTWSLMGIETDKPIITEKAFEYNFTNEGGVGGSVRFLKNITGMWLLEQCRKAWGKEGVSYTYEDIVKLNESVEQFQCFIDPDDECFANPVSMPDAIIDYCRNRGLSVPVTHADFVACIFESLALKYRFVFEQLKQLAPFTIHRMHIIGGGSQNALLNQYTANSLGIEVLAGPTEATAIGNIMMQALGCGVVDSLTEIREYVRRSFQPEVYTPKQSSEWEKAYKKFIKLTQLRR